MLFVCATTARLGVWQLHRYRDRSAVAERRATQHHLPPVTALSELAEDQDYRRIRLRGRYVDTVVATGGISFSKNGYAVVSHLAVEDGTDVLVLRGWIPVPGWEQYLEVSSAPVEVEGILQPIDTTQTVEPVGGTQGKLWPLERETFLWVLSRGATIPYASIATSLGVESPVVVIAGPELEDLEQRHTSNLPAGGYTTYLKVLHHLEYAVQWFSFGGIAFGLWVWFGFRRGRGV